ncbi:MAG: hypothetical protein QG575_498, partial [Euryarchaeota archaeon]|nr:hypothetical protein [Euryarchaeota archaeon]
KFDFTKHVWSKLQADMAGDAVEVVLVALVAAPHGSVQPQAGLDGSATDKVVALAGEGFCGLVLWWHVRTQKD